MEIGRRSVGQNQCAARGSGTDAARIGRGQLGETLTLIRSFSVLAVFLTIAIATSLAADRKSGKADPSIPKSGVDLHHRIGQGSLIVLGTVEKVKRKALIRIEQVLRSDMADPPEVVRVAYAGANRGRDLGENPFKPEDGERAIFILERWTDSRGDFKAADLYRPAGLAKARIPLPKEGTQALIEALEALVEYHDSPRRGMAEAQLAQWLAGPNPWLVDVALDDAARFALAGPDWIPALLARTQDVAPGRRKRALEAMGIALARGRLEERNAPGGGGNSNELVARVREALVRHARTDEDAGVRQTCVILLPEAGLRDLEALLESIAREDPNQDVRYEAASLVHQLKH